MFDLAGIAKQTGAQRHLCVLSSAMATIDINYKVCEFDYWEILASAVHVEDSELNDNRLQDDPQPRPSSFQ
ncbi:hypothetical protein E2C01_069377 [Portunus trituberculatus]|uniref:Uncharacterized protein n=1 Tax=Portunus trituberculatus TaxID=210409 RepID=A0A5B7I2M3_PORTR|nr:hypothetical protein [Portunus trituberculatus]